MEYNQRKAKRENAVVILLALILAYFTYMLIMKALPETLSDYNGHTYVYLPMFSKETWFQGWKTVPYCMWHLGVLGMNHFLRIPLEVSAAYMSCFLALLSYGIVYWMVRRYTAAMGCEENSTKAALLAFGFCILQSQYFSWLDVGGRYLGVYSMNPMHNPTHMSVRPFSLLCFALVYDIWRKQKDNAYKGVFFSMEKGLKRPYIYLAVCLFLSAMAKPTFAEMFVPAVGIIMLVTWIQKIRRKDGSGSVYFKHCLHMFCCALPALGYILFQFLAYFFWGGSYGADGGFIITGWLEVWRMYSENVALSVLLGMSLPILLLLTDIRGFVKDEMGVLALVGYGVGFMEAALWGEGGGKLSHADFIWPMMSGMLLMWMFSMLRLLTLERNHGETRGQRFVIDAGWFLFWLHVFYGLMYIKSLI